MSTIDNCRRSSKIVDNRRRSSTIVENTFRNNNNENKPIYILNNVIK
ncbi:MAG: hypothetical protein GY820_40870 [Gammaproteobacteria bacterium]|nr:hypothetical protein [Gammaproteobacteria bacterium]